MLSSARGLCRQEEGGQRLLKVNFDPALVRVLREVHYFLLLPDLPQQVPAPALKVLPSCFTRLLSFQLGGRVTCLALPCLACLPFSSLFRKQFIALPWIMPLHINQYQDPRHQSWRLQMYERAVVLRQQVGSLELIAGLYNGIQRTMVPVEQPLLEPRMAAVQAALTKGLLVSFLEECVTAHGHSPGGFGSTCQACHAAAR